MKTQKRQRKCLHCKEHFLPDYRHRERQRFCFKADCRRARKRASQKAWLDKPGNEKYFRDEENAKRVREWQKVHPGYWKDTTRWRNSPQPWRVWLARPVAQPYLTRRVLGARPCQTGGYARLANSYLTRPVLDANSSVRRTYRNVGGQYLARRYRDDHPPIVNQRIRHSGHGARSELRKVP